MIFSTQTVRWLDKKTASHPGLGTSDGYMSHFGHFVAREGYNKNYHQHFSAITRQRKCLASCRHLRPERRRKNIWTELGSNPGPPRQATVAFSSSPLPLGFVGRMMQEPIDLPQELSGNFGPWILVPGAEDLVSAHP